MFARVAGSIFVDIDEVRFRDVVQGDTLNALGYKSLVMNVGYCKLFGLESQPM